jgi:hypothetical protein
MNKYKTDGCLFKFRGGGCAASLSTSCRVRWQGIEFEQRRVQEGKRRGCYWRRGIFTLGINTRRSNGVSSAYQTIGRSSNGKLSEVLSTSRCYFFALPLIKIPVQSCFPDDRCQRNILGYVFPLLWSFHN